MRMKADASTSVMANADQEEAGRPKKVVSLYGDKVNEWEVKAWKNSILTEQAGIGRMAWKKTTLSMPGPG